MKSETQVPPSEWLKRIDRILVGLLWGSDGLRRGVTLLVPSDRAPEPNSSRTAWHFRLSFVPVYVWVFLALMQGPHLIKYGGRLLYGDPWITQVRESRYADEFRDLEEVFRRRYQWQFAEAALLFSLFTYAAVWRWRRGAIEPRHAEPCVGADSR